MKRDASASLLLIALFTAGAGFACAPAAPSDAADSAQTATTSSAAATEATVGDAPDGLLGEFQDDYGNRYEISPTMWVQMPHGRFHIRAWQPGERYLIARTDSGNAHAPGMWTRIDWAELSDMAPYEWAYCLSEYQAASRKEAERSETAVRDSLRTGCNGHPFSRMAPVSGTELPVR